MRRPAADLGQLQELQPAKLVDLRDRLKVIASIPQNGEKLLSGHRDSDPHQATVTKKEPGHEQHDRLRILGRHLSGQVAVQRGAEFLVLKKFGKGGKRNSEKVSQGL